MLDSSAQRTLTVAANPAPVQLEQWEKNFLSDIKDRVNAELYEQMGGPNAFAQCHHDLKTCLEIIQKYMVVK